MCATRMCWLAQGKECLGSLALQVANHSLCHVLNVQRTLSQIGIIDLIQCLGVTRGDFLKDPFDIAKIGFQFPQHFVDQRAILYDEQMCIENGGIFRADGFCNALLHFQNLHARLNKRGLEPPDFVRDLRRRDAVTRDVIQVIAHDMNLATEPFPERRLLLQIGFPDARCRSCTCQSKADVKQCEITWLSP